MDDLHEVDLRGHDLVDVFVRRRDLVDQSVGKIELPRAPFHLRA